MSSPAVFVSSTYVDLKHVREHVASFISNMGYLPRLFEKGGIGFDFTKPLDESCYEEVTDCDIFVLIVGGRYGAPASEDVERRFKRYNSITRREYIAARSRNIPIYIFVEKDVLAEFKTYLKNRNNPTVTYAFVDNQLVFELIDDIYRQNLNNFVHAFSRMEEITQILRDQWASMMKSHIKAKSKVIARNTIRINSLKLFYFRKHKKLSRSALAKESGMNKQMISFLEKLKAGKNREFDGYHERYFPEVEFAKLSKLEKALDCPGKLSAGQYDDFLSMYVEFYASNYAGTTGSHGQRHPLLGFQTKIVVFDFDGTITRSRNGMTTWEMLWDISGYSINECAKYHTQFRNKEITHREWCEITLLKFRDRKFSTKTLDEACSQIELMPGFEELVDELHAADKKLYILSGSIREIIRKVVGQKTIGHFEAVKANEMSFSKEGMLTNIVGTPFDFQGKADFLRNIVVENRCSPMDVLFVGNAGNDEWASSSGARTLCVNPTSTDQDNPKKWTYNIRKMEDMREIMSFVI